MPTNEKKIAPVNDAIALVTCTYCHEDVPEDTAEWECQDKSGNRICKKCIEDFDVCNDCEKYVVINKLIRVSDGNRICQACRDNNYSYCTRCDCLINCDELQVYDGENYCESCYDNVVNENDDDNASFQERTYSKTDEFRDATPAKIVKSPRAYGVEIECHYVDSDDVQAIKNIFPSIGAESDGSLSGRALEFQTPVLSGKKGEDYIKKLGQALKDHDFTIKNDCGLHIHLEAVDYNKLANATATDDKKLLIYQDGRYIQNLWRFYLIYEDVLLSFLPASRRDNRYCHSLKESYHAQEIAETSYREDLEKIWYRETDAREVQICKGYQKHDSRYRGINLHTFFTRNILEIRFHSGTINSKKILEWINLHCAILDVIIANPPYLGNNELTKSLEEKTDKFFELMRLPQSSVDYFRTRQEKFKVKTSKVKKPTAELVALIEDELCAD